MAEPILFGLPPELANGSRGLDPREEYQCIARYPVWKPPPYDPWLVDPALEDPGLTLSGAGLEDYFDELEVLYRQAIVLGGTNRRLDEKGGVLAIASRDRTAVREEIMDAVGIWGIQGKDDIWRPIIERAWERRKAILRDVIADSEDPWIGLRDYYRAMDTLPDHPAMVRPRTEVGFEPGSPPVWAYDDWADSEQFTRRSLELQQIATSPGAPLELLNWTAYGVPQSDQDWARAAARAEMSNTMLVGASVVAPGMASARDVRARENQAARPTLTSAPKPPQITDRARSTEVPSRALEVQPASAPSSSRTAPGSETKPAQTGAKPSKGGPAAPSTSTAPDRTVPLAERGFKDPASDRVKSAELEELFGYQQVYPLVRVSGSGPKSSEAARLLPSGTGMGLPSGNGFAEVRFPGTPRPDSPPLGIAAFVPDWTPVADGGSAVLSDPRATLDRGLGPIAEPNEIVFEPVSQITIYNAIIYLPDGTAVWAVDSLGPIPDSWAPVDALGMEPFVGPFLPGAAYAGEFEHYRVSPAYNLLVLRDSRWRRTTPGSGRSAREELGYVIPSHPAWRERLYQSWEDRGMATWLADEGAWQFKDPETGEVLRSDEIDAGHTFDCVDHHHMVMKGLAPQFDDADAFEAARRRLVRQFMNDPMNYVPQSKTRNRSMGARDGRRYNDPQPNWGEKPRSPLP